MSIFDEFKGTLRGQLYFTVFRAVTELVRGPANRELDRVFQHFNAYMETGKDSPELEKVIKAVSERVSAVIDPVKLPTRTSIVYAIPKQKKRTEN